MKTALARLIMKLATACMAGDRRDWASAMEAEFLVATEDQAGLSFASGCLLAAWRDMLTTAEGHRVVASYGLVLGVMLPMAALQLGCAVFGLPDLYPGGHGLTGALLEGSSHERLVRGIYQGAVPALAMLQLLIGFGQLRLAWVFLERDWESARQVLLQTLAASITLITFMGALFLDSRQAVMQAAVVTVELIVLLATTHRQVAEPLIVELEQTN